MVFFPTTIFHGEVLENYITNLWRMYVSRLQLNICVARNRISPSDDVFGVLKLTVLKVIIKPINIKERVIDSFFPCHCKVCRRFTALLLLVCGIFNGFSLKLISH